MGTNGKGSKSRPLSISYDEYSNRWDSIFKKETPKNTSVIKYKHITVNPDYAGKGKIK